MNSSIRTLVPNLRPAEAYTAAREDFKIKTHFHVAILKGFTQCHCRPLPATAGRRRDLKSLAQCRCQTLPLTAGRNQINLILPSGILRQNLKLITFHKKIKMKNASFLIDSENVSQYQVSQ